MSSASGGTSFPIPPTGFDPRLPTWASALNPTGTSVPQTPSFVESKKSLNYTLLERNSLISLINDLSQHN